ncbi:MULTISPECIES: IclR family transcriptional regulator [unclassified Brenneria]|uniref:IclR family transcriptional regulator n=1 Tax=unclassified Brenneria TaxID=2634434 RepID=UPI0029C54F71|nr:MULTISPECIES: IclR family transcriptional regulator [unclassified Brenneria]MDX5626712.1 IclR family transcriptional regulator [Brenneria sp. L3-3Z]MDX5693938.1 IclR family transcriptional regulator [Brenneria sp. L4-2C]MEE3661421.1 IclR family transcriptional regulator [Brenneria sp. g21c3]
MHKKNQKIQVISRAASILRALGCEGISLGALASRTNLPRSTVQRIVDALKEENLVEGSESGVRLGWGISELAKMSYSDVAAQLRRPMEMLYEMTHETVDISTLYGAEVYCLDRIVSDQTVRVVPTADRPKPLYAMANGKAILSSMDDDAIAGLFKHGMPALTKNTITSLDKLLADIHRVRATGFAFDYQEHAEGVCAIGIPLQVHCCSPHAISIVVPSFRFESRLTIMKEALTQVKASCVSILNSYQA